MPDVGRSRTAYRAPRLRRYGRISQITRGFTKSLNCDNGQVPNFTMGEGAICSANGSNDRSNA
jgi:hypothetical protein